MTTRFLVAAFALLLVACGEERDPPPPPPAVPASAGPYDADGKLTAEAGMRQLIRGTLPPRPHVVIVVLEQLRGDRCGDAVAGATHDLMPRLAGLAEQGDAFLHAVTPRPEASAALASLLTGLSPLRHAVSAADPLPRLDARHVTLGEILVQARGYAARAFVGAERLARGTSLWQGFEVHPERVGLFDAPAALTAWRAGQAAGRPTLAVVVADECAMPYGRRHRDPRRVVTRAAGGPERGAAVIGGELLLGVEDQPGVLALGGPAERQAGLAWLFEGHRTEPRLDLVAAARAAYDESVAWADGLLGALLDGLGPETLVVVTSTGGTAFGEHGVLGPGRDLHDEQVRVPLVFGGGTFLAGEGGRMKPASLVDVLPTLLDLLELPVPADLSGVSLEPVLLGQAPRGPVVSQEDEVPATTGRPAAKATQVSVRSMSWKYVVRFDTRAGTVVERAYDLAADPGETKDLAVEGVVGSVGFDGTFCEAVEHVRDGIWGRVEAANSLSYEPYGQGERVLTERPAPCRPK
jgi:arylsulfatase A-like enzyme